ncbi:dihydrodipicolinate synthase family protein [Acididesulfobacillus acetoxydans]|uniref:dihydrodipicolinate synthase family protein n=1 Tax=Acididesulfobacillus acetoxydans TaxID=1561005 RepID=UPI001F0F11D1|nr:dihydrodipicolinate synthase family protein [Acididesulfobacillus acetoxydans]
MKKLKGIVAATVTPIDHFGKVNFQEIPEFISFLLDKGIHGLFPCGSTGEGILLSTDERKKVAELTVKEASGQVPVVIHTGSIDIHEAIELTVHARNIGADGAALIPPYYYSVDEAAILDYYRSIAQEVKDFPLYIYNIPGNVKNVISPMIVVKLHAEFSNILGIKDSSMDFMNFINFKAALPGDFCVLMGNDAQIYSSVLMGGSGAIAATASAFPEPVVEIYESIKAGDLNAALKAQKIVTEIRTIFRSYPPVASYKKALEFRGIKAGVPRLPLRGMTDEESERMTRELSNLGLL